MPVDLPRNADVVIVGAGPAGLAAATALCAEGVANVVVLERESQAGGIPRHCGHYPYGLREYRRLLKGPAYAARLVEAARAAGVRILTNITVTALHPGPRLSITGPDGPTRISAQIILLATGARETSRAARLIGGTKPGGVLSTGALQGMVYLNHQRPFQNPVILGTELVAFSAIMTCGHLGIRPVAMIEPGPRATAPFPSALYPRLRGIPLHLNTDLLAIHGQTRVTGVTLRKGARTWQQACDGVIVSGQFRPDNALLLASHLARDPATLGPEVDQYGRCSDPGYFAAGNLLRAVETAGRCWAEGRAVALAVARALKGGLPADKGIRITATGSALKYALPQRLSPGSDAALPVLQLRVTHPFRGQITISAGGRTTAHRINALPERRITLPLPAAHGPVSLHLEPEP